jgi:hypothetical protein
MGETRIQSKWDCTSEGTLSVLLPSGIKGSWDLTELFLNWADMDTAEKFFAGYGVKQKLSDHCATNGLDVERMTELYDYAVENRELPATKRGGGFGISKKKIAEKIEQRKVPLTADQEALMKELGLMD